MKKNAKINMKNLMNFILEEADDREMEAGASGRSDDGGAKKLRDQVTFYRLGQTNDMPVTWQKFLEKFRKRTDPEYSEFLRLKEKFEE